MPSVTQIVRNIANNKNNNNENVQKKPDIKRNDQMRSMPNLTENLEMNDIINDPR